MDNVVVAITLPKGFRLKSGAALKSDYSWEVVSRITPYYASVDQVRLAGGPLLRKLRDLAVACDVYQFSRDVDTLTPSSGTPDISSGKLYLRFVQTRNRWVMLQSARNLLLNVHTLVGNPGTKTLANFSVAREGSDDRSGFGARLKALEDQVRDLEITIRSGGQYEPGAHVMPAMAAKGVFDWQERTPGRTWINTGYGANVRSVDFGSATGGRGKPLNFYVAPYNSPPIIGMRQGIYNGGYPLAVIYPQIPSVQY